MTSSTSALYCTLALSMHLVQYAYMYEHGYVNDHAPSCVSRQNPATKIVARSVCVCCNTGQPVPFVLLLYTVSSTAKGRYLIFLCVNLRRKWWTLWLVVWESEFRERLVYWNGRNQRNEADDDFRCAGF